MRRYAIRRICRQTAVLASIGTLSLLTACAPRGDFNPANYPESRRADTADTLHGVSIADPYRWLEDEQSDETQAWLDKQSALTETTLTRFADLQAQVASELEAVYGAVSYTHLRAHET